MRMRAFSCAQVAAEWSDDFIRESMV